MKIICDTSAINEVCSNLQRAVSPKSVNPALEGIYIKSTQRGIEFCGYDGEVGVTTVMSAESSSEGGVVINAKKLCDILRNLPEDKMSLEVDDKNKCVIRSGKRNHNIMGIKEDNYPELPYVMGGEPIVLPQKIIKDMIRQVIFAVSLDESKTVHKGVKFELKEGEITLAALDGYRLAVRHEYIDYKGANISFIVPPKALGEVVKLINNDEGFVSINLDKNKIVFTLNGYNIISGLFEGDFIDYKRTIPQTFTTEILVDTQVMNDSIEGTSILITEKFRTPIKCEIDAENNEIRFYSVTAEGDSTDEISAEITGKSTVKGFNSRYFIEALRAVETDRVLIKMNPSPVDPACIFPIEGDSFFYMILPVRLPDEQ
ncbi:MAG: DNA polymerase III subunit beta [Clostridia bacterium]|nr:DNA polymerase III subunit beta [Clostridia bacterium]MBR5427585.1 DNA polymerase III subunit beta [Clostridia bacterium]